MTHILGVGIATLDIIDEVDGYPSEDAEVRALSRRVSLGGNASNSLRVLRQLGHGCDLAAVIAGDGEGKRILSALKAAGVNVDSCKILPGCTSPLSHVCINRRNGSRTIVHFRDLPELGYVDFKSLSLSPYRWVHFEGRNSEDIRKMIHRVRHLAGRQSATSRTRISLEVEKPRLGIERLFAEVDVLLLSKNYARSQDFLRAEDLLMHVREKTPNSLLYCAWGQEGAWVMEPGKAPEFALASTPDQLVDTLGAGDVFNAAIIDALAKGRSPQEALNAAVKLAGRKCGQLGLDKLTSDG